MGLTLVSQRFRFRILTVVDDFTLGCLGLVVDTSLTALRVIRELSPKTPRTIVSDNGTELNSTPYWPGRKSGRSSGVTPHPSSQYHHS